MRAAYAVQVAPDPSRSRAGYAGTQSAGVALPYFDVWVTFYSTFARSTKSLSVPWHPASPSLQLTVRLRVEIALGQPWNQRSVWRGLRTIPPCRGNDACRLAETFSGYPRSLPVTCSKESLARKRSSRALKSMIADRAGRNCLSYMVTSALIVRIHRCETTDTAVLATFEGRQTVDSVLRTC